MLPGSCSQLPSSIYFVPSGFLRSVSSHGTHILISFDRPLQHPAPSTLKTQVWPLYWHLYVSFSGSSPFLQFECFFITSPKICCHWTLWRFVINFMFSFSLDENIWEITSLVRVFDKNYGPWIDHRSCILRSLYSKHMCFLAHTQNTRDPLGLNIHSDSQKSFAELCLEANILSNHHNVLGVNIGTDLKIVS